MSDKFVPTIVLLQNTREKEPVVAQIFWTEAELKQALKNDALVQQIFVTEAEETQQFVTEQFVITLERILAFKKDALLPDRAFEQ